MLTCKIQRTHTVKRFQSILSMYTSIRNKSISHTIGLFDALCPLNARFGPGSLNFSFDDKGDYDQLPLTLRREKHCPRLQITFAE